MEWFGLTIYGFPDPIKDMMRDDYKEPEVQPNVYEVIAKGTKKRFADLISEIDCYTGRADGYAYKSYDRLDRMRKKGYFKPVGPTDMYKYAGTDSMKCSFWRGDPALVGENWYKPRVFKPKPFTDVGRCKLLVVGSGSSGHTMKAKFAHDFKDGELIITEPSNVHYYQPTFTSVGGEIKKLKDIFKYIKDVLPTKSKE